LRRPGGRPLARTSPPRALPPSLPTCPCTGYSLPLQLLCPLVFPLSLLPCDVSPVRPHFACPPLTGMALSRQLATIRIALAWRARAASTRPRLRWTPPVALRRQLPVHTGRFGDARPTLTPRRQDDVGGTSPARRAWQVGSAFGWILVCGRRH